MVIVLTQYEKRSLAIFLGFYIISSAILITAIAILFFMIQSTQIQKDIYNQMLLQSSKIAQIMIYEHMNGRQKFDSVILDSIILPKMQVALFDKNKNRIYGNLDFYEKGEYFFIKNTAAYLLDQGAYGHLGVEWILIKKDFNREKQRLIFYLVFGALFCFGLVLFFGVILGKIFLGPIKQGVLKLDDFIKDITHELNTPISAILMTIDSMKNGINLTKILRIQKACKRIEFLYGNLTFLFLGEIHIFKEKICFDLLLRSRLEMFEGHLLEKNITLDIQIKQCNLFADRESLTRMVDNLLSNAIKYNYKNGVIQINLEQKFLCIQNSGKEIPKEMQKQIKIRYFRLNHENKGYGIGLDIIQKVVSNHGYNLLISHKDSLNTFEIFF